MIRRLLFAFVLCCAALCVKAQSQFGEKPRLVVGIVVDQMRWDYLGRYYDRFAPDGGFHRLIDQGFSCNNCLINYVPTTTGIGHTSAYTGTTPALHGICGNSFYVNGRKTSCTVDESVQPVGANDDKCRMSPHLLLATTIGDQLRLHTDFRSKVIGVSYKARAAILPAGHSANAAYWLSLESPVKFVTSSYYMTELPEWVKRYNARMANDADIQSAGSDIGLTPTCGTMITDMVLAAIEGERLGMGEETDMLCVSYSQTDAIGHKWGTRGEHTDEAYLQLDRDLGRLFTALDGYVGQGNYLVFLTADHGAAHNWGYMQEHNLNAGPWSSGQMKEWIKQQLASALRDDGDYVADIMDYRIFFDWQKIRQRGRNGNDIVHFVLDLVRQMDGVTFAAAFSELATTAMPPQLRDRALMGYYPGRSGDIIFFPQPGFYEHGSWSSPTGTTHGEWNPYDTHIPCLFYGWKVPHGATSREVHITDIAPTVCQMLHIQQPNACVGEAITDITH